MALLAALIVVVGLQMILARTDMSFGSSYIVSVSAAVATLIVVQKSRASRDRKSQPRK
jgi:hypothetical protein